MPKISIDNQEYNVVGEDEILIRQSAQLLNEKIDEVTANQSNNANITSLTKTTLAALNIASAEIKNQNEYSKSINDVIDEVTKIANYINTGIEPKSF
jgi:cell division protein ZapA (FtsZ GTPase activity inhibitor)